MTYELLAQCIRSGQLSERQVAEHMRDEVFARWFKLKEKTWLSPSPKSATS